MSNEYVEYEPCSNSILDLVQTASELRPLLFLHPRQTQLSRHMACSPCVCAGKQHFEVYTDFHKSKRSNAFCTGPMERKMSSTGHKSRIPIRLGLWQPYSSIEEHRQQSSLPSLPCFTRMFLKQQRNPRCYGVAIWKNYTLIGFRNCAVDHTHVPETNSSSFSSSAVQYRGLFLRLLSTCQENISHFDSPSA